jgi:hypothetical protein
MRALRADIGHPTAHLTLLSARYRGLRWCRAQRAPEQANSNKVIPRNTTRPCTHKPCAMSALRRYRPPLRSRSKWRDGPRGDIAASACEMCQLVAVTAPFFDCPGSTTVPARYSSSARRHAPGLMPTNRLKTRVRWL